MSNKTSQHEHTRKEQDLNESNRTTHHQNGHNDDDIEPIFLEISEPTPMTVEITPIGYHSHVDDEAFHVEWEGRSLICGINQIVYLQNIVPLTKGELIYISEEEEDGHIEGVHSFADVEANLIDWFGLP